MKTVVLSRRNLLTLLSKLDRVKAGEASECTLVKHDWHDVWGYSQTPTTVVAMEDDNYYHDREPGEVHPSDEPH